MSNAYVLSNDWVQLSNFLGPLSWGGGPVRSPTLCAWLGPMCTLALVGGLLTVPNIL